MTCRDDVLTAIKSLRQRHCRRDFALIEVVQEVQARGTIYKETTIRTHVSSLMCANAPDHHEVAYDDLVRIGRGRYALA
jgi:hypothetical protein